MNFREFRIVHRSVDDERRSDVLISQTVTTLLCSVATCMARGRRMTSGRFTFHGDADRCRAPS